MADRDALVDDFMDGVRSNAPGQDEFHQAVEEVARDVLTVEKAHSDFTAAKVLEQLTQPDRVIQFRVVWQDDDGDFQINRGWRVQTSNAIGPYKGGLRFHPTVSESVLKFLAFEQCFKNALTGLPLGGAKGGSDFDPSGRSEAEIMRFCQAFMSELSRYIGPDHDVPAGDINVGTREIGWLFGAYKKHQGQFHGALTGKGESFGGSAMRIEATGYGLIYFLEAMLEKTGSAMDAQRIAISGAGNVATHAAEKAIEMGGKVVSLSDSSGALIAEDGFSQDAVDWVCMQKGAGLGLDAPPDTLGVKWHEGKAPWGAVEAGVLLPCATQNELDESALKEAIESGAQIIAEGANMPLTAGAGNLVETQRLLYGPGKASNAGGVAISGLEMSQNAHGQSLTAKAVNKDLRQIMRRIHQTAVDETQGGEVPNYRRGANIAGYRKLATAISALGAI